MRCTSPLLAGAVVTIVCIAIATPAEAEKDPRKAAVKLVQQGDSLFKKRDFAGALAKYQEAYQVFPSAKIYYAMAKAEECLGRSLEALTHYELFLAGVGDDVNENLRVDAQVSVQELERTLALLSFDVHPEGVSVQVDGVELGVSPLARPVRLAPGVHRFRFEKLGFQPVERSATLEAGARPRESVTLERVRPAVVAANPTPPPPRPRVTPTPAPAPARAHGSGAILWTGVATTGALALGGLVTGVLAVQEHERFADPQLAGDERAQARDRGKTLALTSDVLVVGALAAGGLTAWYYLSTRADGAAPAERSVLVPYLAPDGAGLAVAGGF